MTNISKIILENLCDGVPVITTDAVGFYKENCMIAFHNQGHDSGVILEVIYQDERCSFMIVWDGIVTEQLINAYKERTQNVNYAAVAIALSLIIRLTPFTAVEQASLGTTIDYFLAPKIRNDHLIFNDSARLEISGIACENSKNTVESRIKRKQNRLSTAEGMETFIAVVEFCKPYSKMVSV